MSDVRRSLVLALAALSLTFCGVRARGLEVALEIHAPPCAAPMALDLETIELLPCPDTQARIASLAVISVAYAHTTSASAGPFVVAPADAPQIAVVRVPPGSYCDVRVHFGSASSPALAMADGTAAEREAVLRLCDASGEARLDLATPPDRATVRIALGAVDDASTPAHALSEVIDGASATLVMR